MKSMDADMTSHFVQSNNVDNKEHIERPCSDKGRLSSNEKVCKKESVLEALLGEKEISGSTSDLKERRSIENDDDEVEPHFSDLDSGWAWVVLAASFLSFALLGGSMYSVGIIHNALLERFQASVGLTSWVGALHTGILSLGGLLSTAMVDRFSCRTAIIFSGIFYTGGYLATAFVPCIEAALFTCGIVAGIGGALGYTASMVVVGFNFKRHRNLALGVSMSGVGVGVCVFAPVMQMAKEFYGYTGFFICCAGMQINLVTFGMLCFPSSLENYSHTMRLRDSGRLPQDTNVFKRRVMPYVNVMLNKGIVCLCFSMFLYCAATFLLYLHLPTYITTKGFSENQAAFLISLSGILTVVGRLLTGLLANIQHCNEIVLYAGSMTIVSIATIVYPFVSRHYVSHLMYVICLGLFLGSCYVVLTTVSLKFVGINYIATAIGLEFMLGGVGAIVGPVIAGILVDNGGTYDQSVIVAGGCILMAAVCGAFSVCFVAKRTDVNTTFELRVLELPRNVENTSSLGKIDPSGNAYLQ